MASFITWKYISHSWITGAKTGEKTKLVLSSETEWAVDPGDTESVGRLFTHQIIITSFSDLYKFPSTILAIQTMQWREFHITKNLTPFMEQIFNALENEWLLKMSCYGNGFSIDFASAVGSFKWKEVIFTQMEECWMWVKNFKSHSIDELGLWCDITYICVRKTSLE